MIPNLSLGKILYLNSQATSNLLSNTTKKLVTQNINNEEELSAIDYFIISLVNVIEEVNQNGLIGELQKLNVESRNLYGEINLEKQICNSPSFSSFSSSKTDICYDILLNQVILLAINKAQEYTSIKWIIPILETQKKYFLSVSLIDSIDNQDIPNVDYYSSVKREDYEKAILFSKYIINGYDPLEGNKYSFFPEFILDMNVVFEYYVTYSLQRLFKNNFFTKKVYSLGIEPEDNSLKRKYIELDGIYEGESGSVIIDTKNKYKFVIDKEIPEFFASNPDIYQQYYYAARVESDKLILVYPSSKTRSAPLGEYFLNFKNNKTVKLYLWGLQITLTPKENHNALVKLAKFIDSLV